MHVVGGWGGVRMTLQEILHKFPKVHPLEMCLRPFVIGFKIEIVIVFLLCFRPFLGQTYPEFIATGRQLIFNSSYILEAPFLNGVLSSGNTLVPCGKIINGRFDSPILSDGHTGPFVNVSTAA